MNTQNFQSLHNIGSVVQHSEGVSRESDLVGNPGVARARNRRGVFAAFREMLLSPRAFALAGMFFSPLGPSLILYR